MQHLVLEQVLDVSLYDLQSVRRGLVTLAGCCVACPSFYYFFLYIRYQYYRHIEKLPSQRSGIDVPFERVLQELEYRSSDRKPRTEACVKYNGYKLRGSLRQIVPGLKGNLVDAQIISVPVTTQIDSRLSHAPDLILAYCDAEAILTRIEQEQVENNRIVQFMKVVQQGLEQNEAYSGVVLRISISTAFCARTWSTLCRHLKELQLIVYLEVHPPYLDLVSIDLQVIDGVIIRNATVLTDGQRRDYFQGQELRQLLGRCARQRRLRSQFVTIFHDPCDAPSTPVLRRAFKFARSHGAILSVCRPNSSGDEDAVPDAEPLSALDWLKRPDVLELRRSWLGSHIAQHDAASQPDLATLEPLVSGVIAAFATSSVPEASELNVALGEDPPYQLDVTIPIEFSIFLHSPDGEELSTNACYDLRAPIRDLHVASILQGQIRLRQNNLLQRMREEDASRIIVRLQNFIEVYDENLKAKNLLQELIRGLQDDSIVVYRGLDTGFTLPEGHLHMWAVYERDIHKHNIYVSLKVPDLATAVLHTFLLAQGVPRKQCFELELSLESLCDTSAGRQVVSDLPSRISSELETATCSELLTYIYRISHSRVRPCRILTGVNLCARERLLDGTTRHTWRRDHSQKLLAGEINLYDLYQTRLKHFTDAGMGKLPKILALVRMHKKIETTISQFLRYSDQAAIDSVSRILTGTYDGSKHAVALEADLLTLMVVSAFRKIAIEEIYIESTDRCPFYQHQKDQPGVFAEMWTMGSQCEEVLDITANDLGAIIYDKRRLYVRMIRPGQQNSSARDNMSSYQMIEPLIPESPSSKSRIHNPFQQKSQQAFPRSQSLTYKSIILFVALCDVSMIIAFGKGFCHSQDMAPKDNKIITLSLLAAFLLSSGTMSWCAVSGEYYLSNTAFDSMNHVMVQKFACNLLVCVFTGILCGLSVAFSDTWETGMKFFLFLIVFGSALSLSVMLGTMHMDDGPFPSGRLVLLKRLPILLLSPLITTTVPGYEATHYFSILVIFVLDLYKAYGALCAEWALWHRKIVLISDEEVLSWYRSRHPSEKQNPDCELARYTLAADVENVGRSLLSRPYSRTRTTISLVESIVPGLSYSKWLLRKNACLGALQPPLFSSVFNSSLKVALQSHLEFIRGLKEHSSYLQFRFAKFEVLGTMTMCLSSLLDKCIHLTAFDVRHIESAYIQKSTAKDSPWFALMYFLAISVILDYQAQFCKVALNYPSARPLCTTECLKLERRCFLSHRRTVYWETLRDIVLGCFFIFGIITLTLLFWEPALEDLIIYFSYVLSYSFVIFTQYNRIFIHDESRALQIITASNIIGYLSGINGFLKHNLYSGIEPGLFGLAISSLLAVAGTFSAADFSSATNGTRIKSHFQSHVNQTGWKLHSQRHIGLDNEQVARLEQGISKAQSLFISTHGLLITTKTHQELYTLVEDALRGANPGDLLRHALPDWGGLLAGILEQLRLGKVKIYFVSSAALNELGLSTTSAVGWQSASDELRVVLPLQDCPDDDHQRSPQVIAQLIAEALVHETCEVVHKWSHSDATCAEMLLRASGSRLPYRIQCQLSSQSAAKDRIIQRTHSEILNQLCLRVDADIHWPLVPEALRKVIVARVAGEAYNVQGLVRSDMVIYLTLLGMSQPMSSWQQLISKHDARTSLAIAIDRFCKTLTGNDDKVPHTSSNNQAFERIESSLHSPPSRLVNNVRSFCGGAHLWMCHTAAIINGEPDIPRELVYSMRSAPFGRFICLLILRIWSIIIVRVQHFVTLSLLRDQRPDLHGIIQYCQKGASRTLMPCRLVVDHPSQARTGFFHSVTPNLVLHIFPGKLQEPPLSQSQQIATATYDRYRRLIVLELLRGEEVQEVRNYTYKGSSRLPTHGKSASGFTSYDSCGRITSGELLVREQRWSFQYTYTANRSASDLLHASYKNTRNVRINAFWCTASEGESRSTPQKPTMKIQRILYTSEKGKWQSQFSWEHKRHPKIVSSKIAADGIVQHLNTTPIWLTDAVESFGTRPDWLHFADEDVLFYHPPARALTEKLRSLLPFQVSPITHHSRLSTRTLRTMLWQKWLEAASIDGVNARYIDAMLLREEESLGPYWTARDLGRFAVAQKYLDENIEYIASQIELADEVSERTLLPVKLADLYAMTSACTTSITTRKPNDNIDDTDQKLSVLTLDTGCFPDQPGGVSNCRRDLVNGHTTIRNHLLCESANDSGVPRFQIERNVNSIKLLPLWGLDLLVPYHGLYENLLESQIMHREQLTSIGSIERFFVPILELLIEAARSQTHTQSKLAKCTKALVDLSIYFDQYDYLKTWRSNEVKEAWYRCWLVDLPECCKLSDYLQIELPFQAHLDEALEIWIRYFFIFSVRIPEKVPKVFQCTHHGVGSLYGMLLKLRRGTTFMIWDHAIYWREACLNLSCSQGGLSIPVGNMILGLVKLAGQLAYAHADIVVPCTNYFNPGWEIEIGSDQGRRISRTVFARKIEPILNGISEMERFTPTENLRSTIPTVVMLSNIQFIKDVKNAVMSADTIVNKFKFKQYRLMIYGAMDRTPEYAAETQAMIQTHGLEDHVFLAGFGDPQEVLKDAWIFMNSSLSEGLPLAIGEAALSGCPVVATNVGSTASVISDPQDQSIRYGELVPPNDPLALASAQIRLLAMLGPWAKFCGEQHSDMPVKFTEDNVEWITKRMYDKTDCRRALGRKGREIVLQSFDGDRYLREHEQMYWLASFRAQQREESGL